MSVQNDRQPLHVFFSVGEPSGDLHGANLMRELRRRHPQIRLAGYGGPKMSAEGLECHEDLTRLALMGFLRAILLIRQFWTLLRRAEAYFDAQHPDAVVLIDFPGFNWWVARKAKKRGIPVFYYGVPQLWAWAPWRIKKMKKFVDHVLCKLPFEAQWYQQHGCQAMYVGHPYFDQLEQQPPDAAAVAGLRAEPGPLVAVLPGSRSQEVEANLPCFVLTIEKLQERQPHARFAVAAYNDSQAATAREMLAQHGLDVPVYVNRTAELIAASHCCLACSGSVSLELLYYTRPSVVHYRVNRLFLFLVQRFLITVRYVSLVNLLACDDRFDARTGPYDPDAERDRDVPFPEYPTYDDVSDRMADHLSQWISDSHEYHKRVEQLAALKSQLDRDGASLRAAEYMLGVLHGFEDRASGRAA